MLDIKLPEFEKKVYPDLELSLLEPSYKINLRGKNREFFTKAGKLLSIMLPIESNTSANIKNINALWLSPDEWLIYSNDKTNLETINYLEDKLFNEISKVKLGSVTNVTDHWIMINLKGPKVFDLLSAGCPFNFNKFKNSKGAVTQTLLNHVDVIIHNKDTNNLNLFVRRSFSNHLWLWMNDSARFV